MTVAQTKPTTQKRPATIDDLYHVDGKAELVNGVIVETASTGEDPGYAGDRVFRRLDDYAMEMGKGRAVSDGRGFIVNLPNLQSFSPDAAFYIAQRTGMRFVEGAPLFAVEVRSEGDYGPRAEREMAAKRADYFSAGTLVVWDVDLLAPEAVVRVYRADNPETPTLYRRGQIAEAEPAVRGWTMPVDDLFAPP